MKRTIYKRLLISITRQIHAKYESPSQCFHNPMN